MGRVPGQCAGQTGVRDQELRSAGMEEGGELLSGRSATRSAMSCRSVPPDDLHHGDLRHDLAIVISVARRPNCWSVRRQRGLGRRPAPGVLEHLGERWALVSPLGTGDAGGVSPARSIWPAPWRSMCGRTWKPLPAISADSLTMRATMSVLIGPPRRRRISRDSTTGGGPGPIGGDANADGSNNSRPFVCSRFAAHGRTIAVWMGPLIPRPGYR